MWMCLEFKLQFSWNFKQRAWYQKICLLLNFVCNFVFWQSNKDSIFVLICHLLSPCLCSKNAAVSVVKPRHPWENVAFSSWCKRNQNRHHMYKGLAWGLEGARKEIKVRPAKVLQTKGGLRACSPRTCFKFRSSEISSCVFRRTFSVNRYEGKCNS